MCDAVLSALMCETLGAWRKKLTSVNAPKKIFCLNMNFIQSKNFSNKLDKLSKKEPQRKVFQLRLFLDRERETG